MSDKTVKEIGKVITEELGPNYVIMNRILNFKNYGSNSSRTRTLVIGVENSIAEFITPAELFPRYRKEKVLKDVIGQLPELEWGQFSEKDFYHQFRTYPEYMRSWIHDLQQGMSAFDNKEDLKRPYKIVDGKMISNIQKNSDKYTRQYWNKVAPCIHTRNDQLASQNTVHPKQDRVFSIRELMKLMTIPEDFKWIDMSLDELNGLSIPKEPFTLTKEQRIYFSTEEYRNFYRIARNYKTRSLNIDACSCYWFGIMK